jgi:hypothetical protein
MKKGLVKVGLAQTAPETGSGTLRPAEDWAERDRRTWVPDFISGKNKTDYPATSQMDCRSGVSRRMRQSNPPNLAKPIRFAFLNWTAPLVFG